MSVAISRRKQQENAPYQIPTKGKGPEAGYCLEGELLEKFCQLFPIHLNAELAKLFGVSKNTLSRKAKQLGLKKNMSVIVHKTIKKTMATCRENGYYASLKGKRPSDACIAAARRNILNGFSPQRALRERNPEGYKQYLAERGRSLSEQYKRERRRKKLDLPPLTKLHTPEQAYTRKQRQYRRNMKDKCGYILGDYHERFGERWVIYYDSNTKRSKIRERNAKKRGFQIKELTD